MPTKDKPEPPPIRKNPKTGKYEKRFLSDDFAPYVITRSRSVVVGAASKEEAMKVADYNHAFHAAQAITTVTKAETEEQLPPGYDADSMVPCAVHWDTQVQELLDNSVPWTEVCFECELELHGDKQHPVYIFAREHNLLCEMWGHAPQTTDNVPT